GLPVTVVSLPEALIGIILLKGGVIDRSEMTFDADFGVEFPSSIDAVLVDLPCIVVREDLVGPFWRGQSAKRCGSSGKWIRTAQHLLDVVEIFDRDRRAEKPR